MSGVPNPNPDRARRAQATTLQAMLGLQPATTALALAAAPSPAVIAPAGAPVAAAAPATAAIQEGGKATLQPVRQTGLAQPLAPRKRTAAPIRDHPAWKCVEMVGDENEHQPTVKCLGCGKVFKAGASRISDHLFGTGSTAVCTMVLADAAFRANKLKVQEKVSSNVEHKQRKAAIMQVNAAAGSSSAVRASPSAALREADQPAITFQTASKEAVDYQLARFFYACNISANVANHPEWKKLVTKLRTAPVDYKPPDRRKLYGPLLETTVLNLQAETQHLRDAVLRDCGTFVSDGASAG